MLAFSEPRLTYNRNTIYRNINNTHTKEYQLAMQYILTMLNYKHKELNIKLETNLNNTLFFKMLIIINK